MTSAEQHANLLQRLTAYVVQLQMLAEERFKEQGEFSASAYAFRRVAGELNAYFLQPATAAEQEPCTQCGRTPTDRGAPGRRWCSALCEVQWWEDVPGEWAAVAEPVFAYGERGE